jgi:hypothetical protein
MQEETQNGGRLLPNPETVEPRRLAGFGSAPTEDTTETITYAVVDYFGTDIRVMDDGELLLIDLEEFLAAATTISSDDASALGLIHTFLQRMIHPDDFRKFWALVRRHRQGMDAQMAFAKYVMEEMTGHPTPLPSASSGGPQRTEQSSGGDLSSRAQQRLVDAGRPDLGLVVALAQEARDSA